MFSINVYLHILPRQLMPAEDLQPLLDQYKQANVAIEAELTALRARAVLSDQQLAALKAEVAKSVGLAAGKS